MSTKYNQRQLMSSTGFFQAYKQNIPIIYLVITFIFVIIILVMLYTLSLS